MHIFIVCQKWLSAPYLLQKCGRPGGHDEVARMCSLHFSEDYDNIRQFAAGFESCLVLKAGAVPRLFGEPGVPVEKVAANFQ